MMADQLQTEYCVTPNARVTGQITRRRRQIDVLIELRHDSDNSRRIIVDAKKHRRRITVNDVEAFEGLMKDVGATHGFLVCPHGHTQTAERRAQSAISIRLVRRHTPHRAGALPPPRSRTTCATLE
jgi:restriction endonuclease